MYQDLHSHTYYSFCAVDKPEDVVEAAIAGGIKVLGINDHNYGIGLCDESVLRFQTEDRAISYGRSLRRYYDHINLLREKYKDDIIILRGIEINTFKNARYNLPPTEDISYFDYCLVEHLDLEKSHLDGDLFPFIERLGCKVGIAHTDMFAFIEKIGADPLEYFKQMAALGAFWEMNVNYDSAHSYREHAYVKEFFRNPEQQRIIRESGVEISIGFDNHRISEYLPERIKAHCDKLEALGIPFAFAKELRL